MDRLQSMRVFRRVVERASFAAAARDLGISNPAASKHVAALEESLGARLLHRTTRRVTATAAGTAYFERACRVLDEIDAMNQAVGRAASVPSGVLRVSVPLSFGLMHVTSLLPELLEAHPDLTLDVTYSDRFVDLLEERVDVVLRISRSLPDSSSLVSRRLARAAHVLCAAPSYLKRRGRPRSVADIAEHDTVVYSLSTAPGEWTFDGPNGRERVTARGRLVLSTSLAVRDAVVAGAGISLLPSFYVNDELREGTLVPLLERYITAPAILSAVFPESKHVPPKVRVFVEHLRSRFTRAPWALKGQ